MARKSKSSVDTRAFEQSIREIKKTFGPEAATDRAAVFAVLILKKSIQAPIPYDTGALAQSATVIRGKTGVVTFGFDREYAAIQDRGSSILPPKAYGSKKGPNFYFSETLKREAPNVLEGIARLYGQDLAKITRNRKRTAGQISATVSFGGGE